MPEQVKLMRKIASGAEVHNNALSASMKMVLKGYSDAQIRAEFERVVPELRATRGEAKVTRLWEELDEMIRSARERHPMRRGVNRTICSSRLHRRIFLSLPESSIN